MATAKFIKIDRVKLERELKRRDLSYEEVSKECGYAKGYISECLYRGCVRESVMVVLDKLYGIKRERIELEEETTPPVQTELVIEPRRDSIMNEEDWARLYRLMVEAFKEALKG